MSYQEKNITVELTSYLLILGYFLLNWLPMYRAGSLNSNEIFSLWATVILATIISNIVATILTHIVLSIVRAIQTRSDKVEDFIADERDQLIQLKGTRISYVLFSVGVAVSMLTLVFNQPPLVLFSLLILCSIVAEIIGGISQLYLYRRGV